MKIETCDIFIGKAILERVAAYKRGRVALVYDAKVPSHHVQKLAALLEAKTIEVAGGEQVKTRAEKERLEDGLLSQGFGSNDLVVALGGGATLDLVGFVAATYHRGLPLVLVPSTLLAMVDAAIGGKNGINVGGYKNVLGTIYHPKAVFVDVETIAALPKEEWQNGLMEMIKHALLDGPGAVARFKANYAQLKEPHVLIEEITQSIKVKKRFVEAGARRHALNFGHTIAHAIESLEGFQMSHGAAVGMGMLVEGTLSYDLGLIDKSLYNDIGALIELVGIHLQFNRPHSFEAILSACQHDKKAKEGVVLFSLLKHDPDGSLYEVPQELFKEAMSHALCHYTPT